MNKLASIALLLISTLAFGQKDVQLKLIDSFSYETIELDSTLNIKHAKFSIDTITDIITISRIRGRRLKIELPEYDLYSKKERIKKYKGNTVTRQLVPNDSLIEKKFNEIWNASMVKEDTLTFKDVGELKKHLMSYLNYLVVLSDSCDNGICGYWNTYMLEFRLIDNESIMQISSVEKEHDFQFGCADLEEHMQRLISIFPKFRFIDPEESVKTLSYTIIL